MKILYGTGNPAKLEAMKRRLEPLGIELMGLQDIKAMGLTIPEVEETGTTPLENARLKANAYYEAFHMPVFSCDSGLYFDNVPEEIQPGVHVRTINGKYLSDGEMQAYYAGLAGKYGDLTARYCNGICFVQEDGRVHEAMDPTMESERFVLTDCIQPIRKKGFPLDSLSVDRKTGKFYYDLPEGALDRVAVEDGFLEFFKRILEM